MKVKKYRTFVAAAAATLVMTTGLIPGVQGAEGVKIGFLGGFTGPIESLTPGIYNSAALAADNVNAQGGILNGMELSVVQADTTCVDATAAANAADRLVNSENVTAIVGALCSGSTISAANNAGIPGGAVMISPASTSPALTSMEDNDMVFRTAPSDSLQGEKLAKLLMSKGINTIAVTYINNDYGKGFADALANAFTGMGGNVAANVAHEDGKADYRAEIGQLASSGAEHLVVLAYVDGSGQTIIRQAVEGGDFSMFAGGDGMAGGALIEGVGAEALEGMIITRPGSPAGTATDTYSNMVTAGGMEGLLDVPFGPQSYDAAFLLALAIEKNGSAMRDGLSAALRSVASPPGMIIYPGEWEKAAAAIKAGEDINYEGASGSHDFDENGDVDGLIVELTVMGGELMEQGEIM